MTNRYVMFQKDANFVVDTWPTEDADIHVIDAVSEDISMNRGFIYPKTAAQRPPRNRLLGAIALSGEVQTPMYPREASSLLYYLLGTCTTVVDTPTTGINTHTIKQASVPPSFVMAIGKDKMEHRFTGCVMKSGTLDFQPNDANIGSFG